MTLSSSDNTEDQLLFLNHNGVFNVHNYKQMY